MGTHRNPQSVQLTPRKGFAFELVDWEKSGVHNERKKTYFITFV